MEQKLLVGMDVGSYKTAVAVVEPDEKGKTRLLGLCEVPTRGMHKGAITSIAELGDTINSAIDRAEAVTRREIDGVHLSFFGSAFNAQEKYAEIEITNRQQKIIGEERLEAIKQAVVLNTPEMEPVHRIAQEFIVDNAGDIRDPTGMFGHKLGVRIYLVTIRNNIYKSLGACFNKAGVSKLTLAYAPLVASEAVLNQAEINSGVIYLDLGQSAASLVAYQGALRHIRVLNLGGARFTDALARVMKTDLLEAERIKIEYGTCLLDAPPEKFLICNSQGETRGEMDRHTLAEIITAEMDARLIPEIKELRFGKGFTPTAGLVLGGGSARLPGLPEFLESRLDLPVRIGRADFFPERGKEMDDPSYHAVLGVVRANSDLVEGREEVASNGQPARKNLAARLHRVYCRARRTWRRIQSQHF